jgi:D-glycero-D-manno-heptose 1,7-bisphosphate phosphatase
MTQHKRRAVFLDRDGTINVEKNYLHRIEDFEFIPGAPEAIRRLRSAGYLVFVVTNQSGIARGYFSQKDVDCLHERIQQELMSCGTRIDAFYVCPHHPATGAKELRVACDCRKGSPGMLLRAAEEYDIDLKNSFMIGDKLADIEAGQRAGCQTILVLTGYGRASAQKHLLPQVKKCIDICSASDYILSLIHHQ